MLPSAAARPASSREEAAPSSVNSIGHGGASPPVGVGGGGAQDTDDISDLNQIVKWDHRSGHFPLTDVALQQMSFREHPHPRPRYYFAAGLVLYMRAFRTSIEKEVFKTISDWWEDAWLARGPARKGAFAYTDEEANWCSVRMQQGYMRRLDGSTLTSKQMPRMDPL